MSNAKHVMNSKAEWNHSRIPRIVIETGEDVKGDKENGLERADNKEKQREREKGKSKRNPVVKKFEARKRTCLETGPENLAKKTREMEEIESGEGEISRMTERKKEKRNGDKEREKRLREKQWRKGRQMEKEKMVSKDA